MRRTTSQLRLVLTECPRRSRGAAATRLRGLSTPQPRRRRDSATRNLHVAAAAPPRLGYTEFTRRGRGRAATRLRGITTSTQVRPSSRSRSRRGPGPTHRRYPGASGAASRRSRRRPRRPRRRASDLSTKRRAAASGRATTTERAPERVAWRTPLSQLLLNWVDREDGIFASRQMSLTRAAFLDRSPRVQPPGEFLGLCTEQPQFAAPEDCRACLIFHLLRVETRRSDDPRRGMSAIVRKGVRRDDAGRLLKTFILPFDLSRAARKTRSRDRRRGATSRGAARGTSRLVRRTSPVARPQG